MKTNWRFCTKCETEKPEEEFGFTKQYRKHVCKACERKKAQAIRAKEVNMLKDHQGMTDEEIKQWNKAHPYRIDRDMLAYLLGVIRPVGKGLMA